MKWHAVLAWCAGIAIFCVDRLSKWAATQHFFDRFGWPPYLQFELVYNRGVSWGLLHSHETWVFSAVTLVIAGVLVWLMRYTYERLMTGKPIIAEACVLAGALSNMCDRIMYGGVIDFIALSYGAWHFPVFNAADVAISLGVCALFIQHYSEE